MTVSRWLHLEGLVLFAGAVAAYALFGGNWLLFIILLFAPDLSMIGYTVNPRVGAFSYNLVHAYVLPAFLLSIGYALNQPLLIQLALIWFAHIGIDRAVGYGLKYPTEFKDTHMQHV